MAHKQILFRSEAREKILRGENRSDRTADDDVTVGIAGAGCCYATGSLDYRSIIATRTGKDRAYLRLRQAGLSLPPVLLPACKPSPE